MSNVHLIKWKNIILDFSNATNIRTDTAKGAAAKRLFSVNRFGLVLAKTLESQDEKSSGSLINGTSEIDAWQRKEGKRREDNGTDDSDNYHKINKNHDKNVDSSINNDDHSIDNSNDHSDDFFDLESVSSYSDTVAQPTVALKERKRNTNAISENKNKVKIKSKAKKIKKRIDNDDNDDVCVRICDSAKNVLHISLGTRDKDVIYDIRKGN